MEALERELRQSEKTLVCPDVAALADAQPGTVHNPSTIAQAPTSAPRPPSTTAILGAAPSSSVHETSTISPLDQPGPPYDQPTSGVYRQDTLAAPTASEPNRIRYFGDYEIVREIARGGMGVVFQARQMSLNRPVALKMILAGQLAGDTDVKRFYTEAEAAANLDHPGIVPIFEVGQHEGQHYSSMGFVEGQSLAQRLASGPLPPREAAALLAKVADAIEYAHRRGVIHRDLKPGNILLDQNSNPRVTDFGLAKMVRSDSGLTGSGQILGTPSYMPPEQAGGSRGDIGPAADVYALGATLYALLTGRPPFQAATPMDTLIQVINEVPVPPRRLNASIPSDLETICLKCLEKDSGKRYPTAAALADDLRRYLAGAPIVARPVARVERVVKWARRRPAIAALLALVAVVTAAGLGGVLWQWRHAVQAEIETLAQKKLADTQKDLAVENAKRADENASKADENARRAELRLAEGLISQADALSLAGRPVEAHPLYTEAYDKLAELKVPLTAAELGLWSSYQQMVFPLLSFTGHEGAVDCVAICPDGRTALSGSQDMTMKLWDLASGEVLRTFTRHNGYVWCVAIAPDGRTALSGSGSHDKTLKLWDLASGKELRTFSGHSEDVMSVAIAPDGRTALSGSFDKTLKLWDLASGKELRTFTGHSGPVISVAIAPDGRTALSAGGMTLKLWDLASGKELRTFTGHDGVSRVAIAPDGRTALSSGRDRTLKLWDLASGKELRTFTGHSEIVLEHRLCPGRPNCALGECRRAAEALGPGQRKRAARFFNGHSDRVTSVAIAPDGRTALSGSFDETLKLWDLASGQEPRTFTGHSGSVFSVAIAPDGRTALSGSYDKTLKLWDLASGKELRTFTGHSGYVISVAIAPDGRTALSRSRDNELKLWDLASGKELRTFTGHSSGVSSVAIAPDGRTVLSGGADNTLKLWDLTSGKELRNFTGHSGSVYSVAIAPDGRTALSRSHDKTLKLWDLASGKELRTFTGRSDDG